MPLVLMDLLPTRVLGLPSSIEIGKRPDKKFRQGFTGAPAAAGSRKTSNRCPCLLPKVGRAGSFHGVRIGAGPGVRLEVWLKWSAHPFGGIEPAFALYSSEVAVGLLVFLYLVVHNLPQLYMHTVIFSPL